MSIKRDYKVGDRVRVVAGVKGCCSECSRIDKWLKEHKPIGTISLVSSYGGELRFDEAQEMYSDGGATYWWYKFYQIEPAGPLPGDQLTFVFSGPDSRTDTKDVSEKNRTDGKEVKKTEVKRKRPKARKKKTTTYIGDETVSIGTPLIYYDPPTSTSTGT
jgi:hypothetical protein